MLHLKPNPPRTLLPLCIAVTLCTGVRAGDGWSALTAWEGKYPADLAGQDRRPMLDQPPVRETLKRLLPPRERATLMRLDVESPVRKVGDHLLVSKCHPHNCPSEHALIVIDVNAGHLWAGFFHREGGRASTRWYGSDDDFMVLPATIRRDFAASHGE